MLINHTYFDPAKFFRRIVWVIIAACAGVAAVAPSIDWETFEWSWTAVIPVVWGIARAGVGWYKAEIAKHPGKGLWPLVAIPLVAVFAFGAAGCASTSQTVTTMDGDTFHHKGFALLSKQDIKQDAFMEVLPNNSGMTVEIGTQAQQDAEALVPIVSAIVQAVISSGLGNLATHPSSPITPSATETPSQSILSRLNDALTQIQDLRLQLQEMRN